MRKKLSPTLFTKRETQKERKRRKQKWKEKKKDAKLKNSNCIEIFKKRKRRNERKTLDDAELFVRPTDFEHDLSRSFVLL